MYSILGLTSGQTSHYPRVRTLVQGPRQRGERRRSQPTLAPLMPSGRTVPGSLGGTRGRGPSTPGRAPAARRGRLLGLQAGPSPCPACPPSHRPSGAPCPGPAGPCVRQASFSALVTTCVVVSVFIAVALAASLAARAAPSAWSAAKVHAESSSGR